VLEQRLTTNDYLNFLTNELQLLMTDVPVESRRVIFQHDGTSAHVGRRVAAYFIQNDNAVDCIALPVVVQ
jgi:hypothetical protein